MNLSSRFAGPLRRGLSLALFVAMLTVQTTPPLRALDGVLVSGDGNRVALDTARWRGVRLASPQNVAHPASEPLLRLMTGGRGARVTSPDTGCVKSSRAGSHRGRPMLEIILARECLDGRVLTLQLSGAPLRRTETAAKITEFDRNWLAVTFANYLPEYDPGPDAMTEPPSPDLPAFTGPRLRIEIPAATGAGIYRVSKSQLYPAPCVPDGLGCFPSVINPANLKLERGDAEVPIRISGPFTSSTDYFEFHGALLTGENRAGEWEKGDFTDAEAYFLTLESGARLRVTTLDGSIKGYSPANSFLDTARLEKNNQFNGQVDAPGEIHFYDKTQILLCGPGSGSVSFTVPVPNPAPAAAQGPAINVRVRERGFYYPVSALHTVAFQLNGSNQNQTPATTDAEPPVQSIVNGWYYQWPNSATLPKAPIETFSLRFPPASLAAGNNTLTLLLTSIIGQCDSQSLKWIEVDYQRLYIAAGDRLAFSVPAGNSRVQISGLSAGASPANLLLYEITNPNAPQTVSGFTVAAQTLTADFTGSGVTRRFLLVPVSGATLSATALASARDPDLLNPAAGAKYLAIYHPDLVDFTAGSPWSQFLVRKRAQLGAANVKTIPIQEIYNQFSSGRFDPEAIHSFLRQAWSAWTVKPEYVLLVGDATADPKDNLNRAGSGSESTYKNWVPTCNVDDPYDDNAGYWASDAAFANFSASPCGSLAPGDLPQLAVGRLSVRSLAELNVVLGKHAGYSAAAAGPWAGRSLCTTDKIDGGFDVFHTLCDEFAAATPAPQTTTKLYYAMAPYLGSDTNDASAAFAPALRACMNGGSCPGNNGTPTVSGGYGLINYIGHGNQFNWSEHAFFTEVPAFASPRNDTVTNACHPAPVPYPPGISDIDLLCQPAPQTAYLLVFNCLSGAFMSPSPQTILPVNNTDTLAEAAFKKAGGGPVGGIAPTSVGYTANDDVQLDAFRSALNGPSRIRDWGVLTQAIRAAPTSSNVANFSPVFFGDPAQSLKLPAPLPPTGLSATAGNAQVSLNFTASADPTASFVRIYRATQPPGAPSPDPYTLVTCLPVAQTGYLDTGLTNTNTYFYRLASVDNNPAGCSGFEGAWGAAVSATPMNPNPPATPTGMIATDPGIGTSLDYSFTGVADADLLRYTIYWGPAANHTANSMTIAMQPTSGRISGLSPDITYFISVSATNTSLRESPRSAEASAIPRQTFGGIRPAAAVTGLRLIKSGAADIRLNWTPVTTDVFGDATTLTGQRVYRADVRGPGGYNFNVFSPWPRPGFLDAPAAQPLTASSITWLDAGARTAALAPLSLAYLIIESNGQGDGAAGAYLPAGVLDWTLWKSTLTANRLNGGFSLITADLGGTPLPASPLYRLYCKANSAAGIYDRSSAHLNTCAQLNGAFCEGTARYCNDTHLSNGTTYFYAILVEDGHGSSSPY